MSLENGRKSIIETGSFLPEKVSVATTTCYPIWYEGPEDLEDEDEKRREQKVRGDLALEFAAHAVEQGYNLVVVDGKSSIAFRRRLKSLGITTFDEDENDTGMSGSRRQALRLASQIADTKIVVWSEPEKISFIQNLAELTQPIFDGRADMVVPSRRETEFEQSYPDYQVSFEKKSNARWNRIVRTEHLLKEHDADLDVWFGPRIFINDEHLLALSQEKRNFNSRKREVESLDGSKSEIFKSDAHIHPEAWFDATFLFVLRALEEDYKVVGKETVYKHPQRQTQIETDNNEMRKKRFIQSHSINTLTIHEMRQIRSNSLRRELVRLQSRKRTS